MRHNFIASVNDAFWFLLDCLEDCNFFFCTKFTSPRSECFVHGEGVALPKDFHGEVDVVLEFTSWGIFWDLFGKMVCKGIRFFVLENKGFRILHMLLHALLDSLLGAANVELVCFLTCSFVDYQLGAAFSFVDAVCLVPAVAVEALEGFGSDVAK